MSIFRVSGCFERTQVFHPNLDCEESLVASQGQVWEENDPYLAFAVPRLRRQDSAARDQTSLHVAV